MPNVDASPIRFRIDDAAHIDLRRVIRAFRPPLDVVGAYHSHPRGPASPSPADIAEAMYPEWTYVIVGLAGRRVDVRAFRISNGSARAVRLKAAAMNKSR